MTTECVLFDADGVVINGDFFTVKYQKEYQVSYDEMLPFFEGEFQNCILGSEDLKLLIKPWLLKWKWEGTVDEFLQFWFEAEHHVDERIVNYIEKLRKKGIKCCLATNQEKYRTQYLKNQMGFEDLFDDVFSSSDIGYKKPDNEFYKLVLAELKNSYGFSPEEVMFFDDSIANVNAAKELGVDAYFYQKFNDFKEIVNQIFASNTFFNLNINK